MTEAEMRVMQPPAQEPLESGAAEAGRAPPIPRASAGAQPCPLCDFSLGLQSYEKIISVVLSHAVGGALLGSDRSPSSARGPGARLQTYSTR